MNTIITRQIVLDTETTGMNQMGPHHEGHQIIEIGAVEIVQRRLTGNNFHVYLKPDCLVDLEAFNIHGISDEFLFDKPTFTVIADELLNYIRGADLIMHNALFDIGFINYEFSKLNRDIPKIDTICKITDSLALAKQLFPGKRNNLDALCSRYEINNSKRKLHGALLDAQILADVYLAMTGGQTSIEFNIENESQYQENTGSTKYIAQQKNRLPIVRANDEELAAHQSYLDFLKQKSGNCLWHMYSKLKEKIDKSY